MKLKCDRVRASHINTGTSIPEEELPWPDTYGRVMRLPKTVIEVEQRSEVTPYGGLALVTAFLKRFKVAEEINRRVSVLKLYLPYTEADHILAQAMNLYVGGTCLEDLANLQQSEAVKRLVGACRIPDPTTAGDFLRRFETNGRALESLRESTDVIQDQVWKKRGRGKKKMRQATVDLDGHIKPLYGVQKEGADFSYKGSWSYHPLVATLAETGECLAIRNRSGNRPSYEGSGELLDETLPRLKKRFKFVVARGDSDFDREETRVSCNTHDVYFAFVGREFTNRPGLAESLPENAWKPFQTRAQRQKNEAKKRAGFKHRRKKRNRRRQKAQDRNYKELRLVRQWVAEVPYQYVNSADSDRVYRLTIRRQLIEQHKGQQFLFEEYRYRYVINSFPKEMSPQDVIDETYERCDQENLIEQMGSGIAAWRMPVAEFMGNCAWLEIARLAWNLAKWISQLYLDPEVGRWEWKRFRHAFVYIAAQVLRVSRQIVVRISASHRFADTLLATHEKIQV